MWELQGLREGGAPWLVRHGDAEAVLRPSADPVEVAALELAGAHGVPVPSVLSVAGPSLLVSRLPGTSRLASEPSATRLRSLAAAVALIHGVPVTAARGLPARDRPISTVDFDALRRAEEARPLLVEAESVLAALPVPSRPTAFLHGDFWHGNTLWDGETLTGIVDWDCAGVGQAGVDVGSLRCDAALCAGSDAADVALAGYEEAAGHPADDVAYWDVVAALATPPTMAWFVSAIRDQGRTDLDQTILMARRDAFLAAALGRLH